MKFLRNLFASIIGFFIALFLLFLLSVGMIAMLGKNDTVVVKPNSILELDISSTIKDYAPNSTNPIEEFLNMAEDKLSLNKIINAIENAKEDDNIKGISIKTPMVSAGMAQLQTIRKSLKKFKESGKFIYAYNDVYDQKNYYISSVADSVFLSPTGAIDFKGLSIEILYYKDFEDKYGIKMEVIRHGKYKSAVEPYLLNKMSDANREQTTSFLKSIWSEMESEISKSRNITIEKLETIANNTLGRNATLAKNNNLIDDVIYEDQYEEKLKQVSDTKKLKFISLENYIDSGKGNIYSNAKDKIAVIYAQGTIKYGKGNENFIGQEIMKKSIRKAVKNEHIKAIVLRVNSPGGSALASELIWRELELAKKEKPLVVSMGNLAASGGYYISCNADKIIAEPTTITGSIGVFGAVLNIAKLSEKIGINAEQVATNKSASYSIYKPINEKFYNVTKEGIEDTYNTFINRVAKGRKMTKEQVNEVAQGRVWTGKEAVEKGLVDQLGSLQDAIKVAAKLASVDDYGIYNYPKYKRDFKETLKINPFIKSKKETILKEELGEEVFMLYNGIKDFKEMKGVQARVPFVFKIK